MADQIKGEIDVARRSARASHKRREAMYTLINSSTSDSSIVISLILQHLTEFAADFPEDRYDVLNAAYDICEKEDGKIRLEGYKLLTNLAEMDNGENVGATSDAMLQMLNAAHGDQLEDEITAIEQSFVSIICSHPAHALGLLTTHLDKLSGNIPPELVWNLLSGPVEEEVKKVIRGEGEKDVEAQKVVSQNLYQLLEAGDADSRHKSIDLLLTFSTITGSLATKETSTHLLSQIVYCALELSNTSTDLPLLNTYLNQIDTLLNLLPSSITLDTRWLLLLYYHFPTPVFAWAKKSEDKIKPGDGPSRLVDWLITAWGVWKKEHMSGEVAVDEKLILTRLGPQVMEAAFKQAPTFVKDPVTLLNVMPCITDLEVCILLTYFTFLKFKGRNNDIFDEASKTKMAQIADVCEKGLATAVGASQLVRTKWENVQRMIQNLLSRKTDTVQPSWTLAAVPPVPTPITAPTPSVTIPSPSPVIAMPPPAATSSAPAAGPSSFPAVKAIPTGPARMQIAGRTTGGPPARRGSYNEQSRASGSGSQSPAMPAGPRVDRDSRQAQGVRNGGMTIKRAVSPPPSTGPSAPFSMSIRSASTKATPPPSTTTVDTPRQDIGENSGANGPSARPANLAIRNTGGGISIRNTSPAAARPPAALSATSASATTPVVIPAQPSGNAAGKRKREEGEREVPVANPSIATPSARGPSLLSRLGMGAGAAGTPQRAQTPPLRNSAPASVVAQPTPQSPPSKRRKSAGNPPQIPPGHPSLLDRMQGVTATGPGHNKAIPSLLARMQPSTPSNGSSATGVASVGQRVTQPRQFPAAQRPSIPPTQSSSSSLPPTGPAAQSDGVVRRGRGFANAGIALPPQNQGFAVKGRTNR